MNNSQQSQDQKQESKETTANRPEHITKDEQVNSTSISELISSLS